MIKDCRKICPVCGYDDLDERPFTEGGYPTYEICPCCGFEFGYDDEAAGFSYTAFREKWIAGGFRWFENVFGRKIECYYCRNLESLKGIDDVSATLKGLLVENSKKLLDYDPISKCTELNSLVFSKCGDMSSLSLLSSLSKLTHFCMLETTVKDGDISQLLSIEKVAITNKQHYNYKLTLSNKWIKR
jgi:hypothetical protein